jgi:hypothetical protein
MKKVITLTENDLNKIIKKIIYEQGQPQLPLRDLSPNRERGEFVPYAVKDRGDVSNEIGLSREVKLGKNLFKLGSSEVNTNSNEFKQALNLFSGKNISNAVITPGVSGVSYRGERSDGPRNIALGQNRAKSFINALKANGLTSINLTIEPTIIGTNTIPNSPEANAEQFVSVKYSEASKDNVPIPAIDNTATLRKPYITGEELEIVPIPIGKESTKICLQITVYNRNYPRLLEQIKMIKRFGTVKNIKCP